jgi:hypothetical protein
METADALKKELREMGLSREWLAQACRCSMSTINHALANGGNDKTRQRIAIVTQAERKRRELQALVSAAEAIIRAAKDEGVDNNQPTNAKKMKCPACDDLRMIPSDDPCGDVMNTPCPDCNEPIRASSPSYHGHPRCQKRGEGHWMHGECISSANDTGHATADNHQPKQQNGN